MCRDRTRIKTSCFNQTDGSGLWGHETKTINNQFFECNIQLILGAGEPAANSCGRAKLQERKKKTKTENYANVEQKHNTNYLNILSKDGKMILPL